MAASSLTRALSKGTYVHNIDLLSKFRGALVGAVVGDCLGAYYEGDVTVNSECLTDFFSGLAASEKKRLHVYTDDTAMARSVAASLLASRSFDAKDMAQRFVTEYEANRNRGYGANIGNVFKQLRDESFKHPFGPAATQFNGTGSYGNGGAMRICPAALFGYNYNEQQLQDLVEGITRLTHSHPDACKGALLQCSAVKLALSQSCDMNCSEFVDKLHTQILQLEEKAEKQTLDDGSPVVKRRVKRKSEEEPMPFCFKLKRAKEFLLQDTEVSRDEVVDTFGNDISALGSVPTAVYSFLRSMSPISDIKTDNPFERTIMYAISLGGDTDTIATMAGAIAGALYGIDQIPESWQKTCEGVTDALLYADQFHALLSEKKA